MAQIEQGRAHGRPSTHRLAETIVERICRIACVARLNLLSSKS